MKLEYLDNISDSGRYKNVVSENLVRLYDFDQKETKELAVMVDTFHPLMLTKEALNIENKDYVMSWAE